MTIFDADVCDVVSSLRSDLEIVGKRHNRTVADEYVSDFAKRGLQHNAVIARYDKTMINADVARSANIDPVAVGNINIVVNHNIFNANISAALQL